MKFASWNKEKGARKSIWIVSHSSIFVSKQENRLLLYDEPDDIYDFIAELNIYSYISFIFSMKD